MIKNPLAKGRIEFNSWVRKIPWRKARQPTPVFLPEESHGQWSLVGYSPWGLKASDTTEVNCMHTHTHTHTHTHRVIKLQSWDLKLCESSAEPSRSRIIKLRIDSLDVPKILNHPYGSFNKHF